VDDNMVETVMHKHEQSSKKQTAASVGPSVLLSEERDHRRAELTDGVDISNMLS
jgi:hypothetical protein